MPTMQLTRYDANTNPHSKLTMHLERHQYKKGVYQGHAPADPARRGKDHYRVVRANNGDMIVRFHQCDMLRVKPDGTITLRCDGWADAPTTRAAFSEAIHRFTPYRLYLRTVQLNGYANIVLAGYTDGKPTQLAWAEGSTISPDGLLDNHGAHVYRWVADTQARRAWVNQPEVKAFRSAFPLLWGAVPPTRDPSSWAAMRDALPRPWYTAAETPELWHYLVQRIKQDVPAAGHEQAWAHLYKQATQTMRYKVRVY